MQVQLICAAENDPSNDYTDPNVPGDHGIKMLATENVTAVITS